MEDRELRHSGRLPARAVAAVLRSFPGLCSWRRASAPAHPSRDCLLSVTDQGGGFRVRPSCPVLLAEYPPGLPIGLGHLASPSALSLGSSGVPLYLTSGTASPPWQLPPENPMGSMLSQALFPILGHAGHGRGDDPSQPLSMERVSDDSNAGRRGQGPWVGRRAVCPAEYCPERMPVHGAVGCREVQPEVTGLSQAREAQQ